MKVVAIRKDRILPVTCQVVATVNSDLEDRSRLTDFGHDHASAIAPRVLFKGDRCRRPFCASADNRVVLAELILGTETSIITQKPTQSRLVEEPNNTKGGARCKEDKLCWAFSHNRTTRRTD